MEQRYGTACGVDVHKKILVGTIKDGKGLILREKFGTSTNEIVRMSDWIQVNNVEMTQMESTGCYWKPVYNILEKKGVPCGVVNPQHIKNVPGRKTDVNDSEWLADLTLFGLARPSYIPSKHQRELREACMFRTSVIAERTRWLNRAQKILEGGNIKLSGTVSDITSKTARNLLGVVASGGKLDGDLYDRMYANNEIAHNLKAEKDTLIEDMNGELSEIQKYELLNMLQMIDNLTEQKGQIEQKIINMMSDPETDAAVRLTQIPGIGMPGATAIISVIGLDMSRWPTAGHLASWAGLCPGNNESAGKRKSGRTTHGNQLLKTTLVNAAHAAVRNKRSFFYAQYQRLLHRGKKRAIVGVAHSILIAIYYMIKNGTDFHDLGSDYYDTRYRDRKVKSGVKRLKKMGCNVVILDSASSAEEAAELAKAAFIAMQSENDATKAKDTDAPKAEDTDAPKAPKAAASKKASKAAASKKASKAAASKKASKAAASKKAPKAEDTDATGAPKAAATDVSEAAATDVSETAATDAPKADAPKAPKAEDTAATGAPKADAADVSEAAATDVSETAATDAPKAAAPKAPKAAASKKASKAAASKKAPKAAAPKAEDGPTTAACSLPPPRS